MENLLKKVKIDVSENIYIKDPFSSELGKSIIEKSLNLIVELGLEHFTFKKLAVEIGCTETAIYRYFENKHKLMLYFTLWYWGFLEHNLVLATANIEDSRQKVKLAIEILVLGPKYINNDYIDPLALKRLLTDEALKAIMTKEIDQEYKSGIFFQMDKFVLRVASLLEELNPSYKFPKALVSTIMEASLVQTYFANHLSQLTEIDLEESLKIEFFTDLVFKAISYEK